MDTIQSHDNEYADLSQEVNETIPALRRVQETGKAHVVGVTGYQLAIFPRILRQTDVDTVLSYNHYTLNDATLLGLLPLLQPKDIGLINAAPLSQGLLTTRGTPEWRPAPPARLK